MPDNEVEPVPPYIAPIEVVAVQTPPATLTGPFQPDESWPVPPCEAPRVPTRPVAKTLPNC